MRRSPEAVILSAAKDLRLARREILRCAQDDSLWLVPFLKHLSVEALAVALVSNTSRSQYVFERFLPSARSTCYV
jgi:hypothetical protein